MDYKLAENKIKKLISNTQEDVLQKIVDFLYENFEKYTWVGIYIVEDGTLVLGPWRGKQATEHTRIPVGKGICGSSAATGKTELISDVNSDNRYLACFVSTKSEIVVPIKKEGHVIAEIDIDSDARDAFNNEDKIFLEKIADMLKEHI
ncbi:MAG TPA: GAF domain-containing protein [Thermoplasmatales archaeon]|nr:GAF domain-containing protein [Thermoplasmatales archaeon]